MSCARLALMGLLATVWIIGTSAAGSVELSTQMTPARPSDVMLRKGASFNTTKIAAVESEADRKRRLRAQRKEKRERRREKKRLRKLKRRERRLRRKQQKALSGDDNGKREGKKKKKGKKGKKGRKGKKGKKRKKKNKNKKKRNKDRRKKRKEKRREKNGKRKRRNRKKRPRARKRKQPAVPCKTDADCEKAGLKHCCQFAIGRCVRPRGGLKCFGSCMCNARKTTENFICVTKKKKFEKFLAAKKLGSVTYEKPRGHCSNVTLSKLQDPSYKYQQIP